MNTCRARMPRITQRRWMTCAAAVASACFAVLAPTPRAHALTPPPPVPPNLEVPAQNKLFRAEHAFGTQNYVCLPSTSAPSGFAWTLHGPQATLFSTNERQTATHYLSENPEEAGARRPTWQDSRDSSAVWGNPIESSTDPAYVDADAVAWLKVEVVGRAVGPTGGRRMYRTSYIQRLNTVGGKAPADGCASAGDIGKRALVPYETDYFFYKSTARD